MQPRNYASAAFLLAAGLLGVIWGTSNTPLEMTSLETTEARVIDSAQKPPAPTSLRLQASERRLEAGQFSIHEVDGQITLISNEVWRIEILESLATRGRFTLVDYERRHSLVSIELHDQSIEQVLAALVRDTAYTIRYAPETRTEGLGIDVLELGSPDLIAERDGSAHPRPAKEAMRLAKLGDHKAKLASDPIPPAPRPEADRRRALERRDARQADRHATNLEELNHEDPEVRAWAAASLDIDDPADLNPLQWLLGNDPDPMVRAEIAYDLGFGEPNAVLPLLVSALDDPSPSVVAVAAESLGYLDDASAVRDLQPLLVNESLDVREAAQNALALIAAVE